MGCAWIAYTQAPAPQGKQQVFTAKGGLWANPNVVNKLDQIMAELKNSKHFSFFWSLLGSHGY